MKKARRAERPSVGFSPSRGRVYLRDGMGRGLFSSFDGVKLELTSLPPTDLRPAVVVPGDTVEEIGDAEWVGNLTDFKGM